MTVTGLGTQDPELSVVIPLHGGAEFIADTLVALRDHTPVRFETIVVDNASPDGAGEIAGSFPNVVMVANGENLGFGTACNQGAARARANLVCFLNSDARVEPGWFEPLAHAMAVDEAVSVALPCYLEPDGRVQEAGAAVDGTGEGVLLGHGTERDDPRYRFARDVDYGSGACLLTRRDHFHEAGGFDPAFGLAYYEDADLELRLGEQGRRVRFVPSSTVTHIRGASAGEHGLDDLRRRNRELLSTRHSVTLGDRPPYAELEMHPERVLQLRDVRCPHRAMIFVGGLASGSVVGEIVADMARLWPANRVTLISQAPVPDDGSWSEAGVETAAALDDWTGWMRGRVGQATLAWTIGDAARDHFDTHIATTQPQALRLHWPAAPDESTWQEEREPTDSTGVPLSVPDLIVDPDTARELVSSPRSGLPRLLSHAGWLRPRGIAV